MNYDPDHEAADHSPQDREFTLSPAVIFGLFFSLVIVCSVCFGLGYSMGGHKTVPPALAETTASNPVPAPVTSAKPSAGSPAGNTTTITPKPMSVAPSTTPVGAATAPAPIVHTPPPATAPTPHSPAPAPIITGEYVVQVAAISLAHQNDAQSLAYTLRSKGYSVNAFPEPDKLIHIQAGPFASRAAAEAMRARLAADGYQPLIKQQ
jgi:cell division septation protein DedD